MGSAAADYNDSLRLWSPSESLSLGRNFRIGSEGKYSLKIRAPRQGALRARSDAFRLLHAFRQRMPRDPRVR